MGAKCNSCGKIGHFSKVCKSKERINQVGDNQQEKPQSNYNKDDDETESYAINIFSIQTSKDSTLRLCSGITKKNEFKVQVIIHNVLDTVIADNGAKICVCGTKQAKKWGLLNKMMRSKKKIKPYNSLPIPVQGEARCAVTFGSTSVPTIWHIISGSWEPILDGNTAMRLGIISFNSHPKVFQPVLMIGTECRQEIQECLAKYPENFRGLGKLNNYQVKLHVNEGIKPVNAPRSTPYHLQERAANLIKEMIEQDVIEEHPIDQPAPWVSNCVLAPKEDGSMRMTIDARNVNKALIQTNQPIPRHEDVKSKLAGKKVFSKMDLKSAFWQLELDPESRYLTVFQIDDKLYRYKRLTMGLKAPISDLITVVTDHKPLCSIFNGVIKGSIRTERIKIRHQDVRFQVIYQRGTLNQSDFISRRGKPFTQIPKEQQEEMDDLNNLLYMIHSTPVMDKLDLPTIAEETKKDKTLSELSKIVQSSQKWISKNAPDLLRKFEPILPEIMVTPRGLLLKGDMIILPEILQVEAIQLAHRGSHPRHADMERRLRSHFFFHNMHKRLICFYKHV